MAEVTVILFRDECWEGIPAELRARVVAGVERVRSQMNAIAQQARVRTMPRVLVQPCVWHCDGRPVHATMCTLVATPARPELGIVVSATVVLCRDDEVVRNVLLHEVGHCFETARKLVDGDDLGTTIADLRGNPMDEARDRRMLPVMSDWFVAKDGAFMRWGDDPIVPITELQALLDAGHLVLSEPPLMAPGKPTIPPDWVDHIRTLRHP